MQPTISSSPPCSAKFEESSIKLAHFRHLFIPLDHNTLFFWLLCHSTDTFRTFPFQFLLCPKSWAQLCHVSFPTLQLVTPSPFTSSGTWYLPSAYFKQLRSCSDSWRTANQPSATPFFSFSTKLGHPLDLWRELWGSHLLLLASIHLLYFWLSLKLTLPKKDASIMREEFSFLSYSLQGGKS